MNRLSPSPTPDSAQAAIDWAEHVVDNHWNDLDDAQINALSELGQHAETLKAQLRREVQSIELLKGGERYVIRYTPESRKDCLRQIGAWASNPLLSLDWCDAAAMQRAVREKADRCGGES